MSFESVFNNDTLTRRKYKRMKQKEKQKYNDKTREFCKNIYTYKDNN